MVKKKRTKADFGDNCVKIEATETMKDGKRLYKVTRKKPKAGAGASEANERGVLKPPAVIPAAEICKTLTMPKKGKKSIPANEPLEAYLNKKLIEQMEKISTDKSAKVKPKEAAKTELKDLIPTGDLAAGFTHEILKGGGEARMDSLKDFHQKAMQIKDPKELIKKAPALFGLYKGIVGYEGTQGRLPGAVDIHCECILHFIKSIPKLGTLQPYQWEIYMDWLLDRLADNRPPEKMKTKLLFAIAHRFGPVDFITRLILKTEAAGNKPKLRKAVFTQAGELISHFGIREFGDKLWICLNAAHKVYAVSKSPGKDGVTAFVKQVVKQTGGPNGKFYNAIMGDLLADSANRKKFDRVWNGKDFKDCSKFEQKRIRFGESIPSFSSGKEEFEEVVEEVYMSDVEVEESAAQEKEEEAAPADGGGGGGGAAPAAAAAAAAGAPPAIDTAAAAAAAAEPEAPVKTPRPPREPTPEPDPGPFDFTLKDLGKRKARMEKKLSKDPWKASDFPTGDCKKFYEQYLTDKKHEAKVDEAFIHEIRPEMFKETKNQTLAPKKYDQVMKVFEAWNNDNPKSLRINLDIVLWWFCDNMFGNPKKKDPKMWKAFLPTFAAILDCVKTRDLHLPFQRWEVGFFLPALMKTACKEKSAAIAEPIGEIMDKVEECYDTAQMFDWYFKCLVYQLKSKPKKMEAIEHTWLLTRFVRFMKGYGLGYLFPKKASQKKKFGKLRIEAAKAMLAAFPLYSATKMKEERLDLLRFASRLAPEKLWIEAFKKVKLGKKEQPLIDELRSENPQCKSWTKEYGPPEKLFIATVWKAEEKREKELAARMERLKLLKNAPPGAVDVDVDGNFLDSEGNIIGGPDKDGGGLGANALGGAFGGAGGPSDAMKPLWKPPGTDAHLTVNDLLLLKYGPEFNPEDWAHPFQLYNGLPKAFQVNYEDFESFERDSAGRSEIKKPFYVSRTGLAIYLDPTRQLTADGLIAVTFVQQAPPKDGSDEHKSAGAGYDESRIAQMKKAGTLPLGYHLSEIELERKAEAEDIFLSMHRTLNEYYLGNSGSREAVVAARYGVDVLQYEAVSRVMELMLARNPDALQTLKDWIERGKNTEGIEQRIADLIQELVSWLNECRRNRYGIGRNSKMGGSSVTSMKLSEESKMDDKDETTARMDGGGPSSASAVAGAVTGSSSSKIKSQGLSNEPIIPMNILMCLNLLTQMPALVKLPSRVIRVLIDQLLDITYLTPPESFSADYYVFFLKKSNKCLADSARNLHNFDAMREILNIWIAMDRFTNDSEKKSNPELRKAASCARLFAILFSNWSTKASEDAIEDRFMFTEDRMRQLLADIRRFFLKHSVDLMHTAPPEFVNVVECVLTLIAYFRRLKGSSWFLSYAEATGLTERHNRGQTDDIDKLMLYYALLSQDPDLEDYLETQAKRSGGSAAKGGKPKHGYSATMSLR